MKEKKVIYSKTIKDVQVDIVDTGSAYEAYANGVLRDSVEVNEFDRQYEELYIFIAKIVAEEYIMEKRLKEAIKLAKK